MSYVLHGILIPDRLEHAEQLLHSTNIFDEQLRDSHELVQIDEKTSMLVNRERYSIAIPDAATEHLKSVYNKLLMVHWDDQHGVRESVLFLDGGRQFFSDFDEEFVELDDSGLPITDGPRFSKLQIDTYSGDREFETCTNAIELGCKASGVFDERAIMRFIRRQG